MTFGNEKFERVNCNIYFLTERDIRKEYEHGCGLVSLMFPYLNLGSRCRLLNIAEETDFAKECFANELFLKGKILYFQNELQHTRDKLM